MTIRKRDSWKTWFAALLWMVAVNYCFLSPTCFALTVHEHESSAHDCCDHEKNSNQQKSCDDCGLCITAIPTDSSQLLQNSIMQEYPLLPVSIEFSHLGARDANSDCVVSNRFCDRDKSPPHLVFLTRSHPNAPPLLIA